MDLNDVLRSAGPDAVRGHFDRNTRPWKSAMPDECGPVSAPRSSDHTHRFTNTMDIMSATFPPLTWAIEGYVPEGFSVLAGRQKLGKSRMALDFSAAIATGGIALGMIRCEQGDVLYIDLENGPRRVQRRLREMFADERHFPDLSRLQWRFEAPNIGAGFIEMVDGWYGYAAAPRLVVVDVLQRIKGARRRRTRLPTSGTTIASAGCKPGPRTDASHCSRCTTPGRAAPTIR